MENKLKEFIAGITFTEPAKINSNTLLFDEGIFDSMGLLSLISFLEEEYGVKVDDLELSEENFQSIKAISSFIEQKQK
ncbi:acyl carrier protein [Marinilabiliaceae bacterium JC017]|nr:acyl carrier protein [Marinilabiliaceae bacterium JC017]